MSERRRLGRVEPARRGGRTLGPPAESCEPGGRGGFTLMEVMLAMVVLMIGMSVLLSLLTFGAAVTRTAALRTTSSTAIEAVVHDLEECLFPLQPDGSAGDPVPIEGRPVPGAPGTIYSATATPNPDGPHDGEVPLEYRVEVEVRWKASGVQRARRYETILLREIPFGERLRRRFVERAADPQQAQPESQPGSEEDPRE